LTDHLLSGRKSINANDKVLKAIGGKFNCGAAKATSPTFIKMNAVIIG